MWINASYVCTTTIGCHILVEEFTSWRLCQRQMTGYSDPNGTRCRHNSPINFLRKNQRWTGYSFV
eukprot:gene90-11542_t